jgi:hypothetical protein
MIAMNIQPSTRQAIRGTTLARALATATLAILLLIALHTPSSATAHTQGDRQTRAHATSALDVADTAHLRFVRESDSRLIDEGTAAGTLPGSVRVSFNVDATIAATFTIYAHSGSIIGHGTGTLHKSKSRSDVYVSFAGTMTVAHGTGRYTHAHGTGGFYGVIDRHNYAATIQTTGTLSY